MGFENMDIWQRSARLSTELYKKLTTCRDFGFRDQITRSGLSIPSNIAEGAERDSKKDFIRFLHYAKGSCGELRTQVYIGVRIHYIAPDQGALWIQETRELSSMLASFIDLLRKQLVASN